MDDSLYLSGKVRKNALPIYESAPPAGAPVLKRLMLPQGELAQFYDSAEPICYLAFIELRPGTARGNHYHKVKEELIYVLRGRFLLLLEDVETKARAEIPMAAGEWVQIPPLIAHTISVLEAGEAVEASKARFDHADIYRYPSAPDRVNESDSPRLGRDVQ